jgi:F0F1-type ATP synthase delta subunit
MSCQVISAIPLSASLKSNVIDWLKLSKIPAETVTFKVKKDLLCGLKITFKGKTLDCSGKYRLETIEKQIGVL